MEDFHTYILLMLTYSVAVTILAFFAMANAKAKKELLQLYKEERAAYYQRYVMLLELISVTDDQQGSKTLTTLVRNVKYSRHENAKDRCDLIILDHNAVLNWRQKFLVENPELGHLDDQVMLTAHLDVGDIYNEQ